MENPYTLVTEHPSSSETIAALVSAADQVMDIESFRQPATAEQSKRRAANFDLEIRGRLRVPSEQAYAIVSERFRHLGHVAYFRRAPDGHVILATPGELPQAAAKPKLALTLFIATAISMMFVHVQQRADGSIDWLSGWPFALGLLSILLAHEMGHYLMARRLGVPASFPYFIPLPLSLFGTMGAVMQMKAPPRNRRALLAVGAAGPLAGLVVAIPVLILGLTLSEVREVDPSAFSLQEGNSLLYAALKIWIFGQHLPANGVDVILHPVAMAGWAGLLVTALNLMPVGQLDGGHVLYTVFGERSRLVGMAIIGMLVGLSFLWQGWLLWVALMLFFGRYHAVPLDDITTLRWPERRLALAVLVIAVLVFVPIPIS
jgi:Zn-dependent protease